MNVGDFFKFAFLLDIQEEVRRPVYNYMLPDNLEFLSLRHKVEYFSSSLLNAIAGVQENYPLTFHFPRIKQIAKYSVMSYRFPCED